MAYNTPLQVERPYHDHSSYADNRPEYQAYDSLLQWPRNGYFNRFSPDATLLQEALTSYSQTPTSTVADQVFGHQARQQKVSLRHHANILYERALLHRNHLKDIDRRLMEFHERLSIMKMHFPLDGGKTQQTMERLIIELERQRHDEDLSFWKDSIEIRQKLFDGACTYSGIQHRKHILGGMEEAL